MAFLDAHPWRLAIGIWGLALFALGWVPLTHEFGANPVALSAAHAGDISAEVGADKLPADVADLPVPAPSAAMVAESRMSSRGIEVDRVAEGGVTDRGMFAANVKGPSEPTAIESARPSLNAAAERAETALLANVEKAPAGQALAPPPPPAGCKGDFGTALTFARNPVQAAKQAKQDKKLVFFLHVSGNFEDSGFT